MGQVGEKLSLQDAIDRILEGGGNRDRITGLKVNKPTDQGSGSERGLLGDWLDEQELAEYRETVKINRMVAAGKIPSLFKVPAECQKCGIILLDYCPEGKVIACPWCLCEHKPKFLLQ